MNRLLLTMLLVLSALPARAAGVGGMFEAGRNRSTVSTVSVTESKPLKRFLAARGHRTPR